ncbi:MAG: glycosyltransferase family 2 protein [Candidatus Omnitrophota bacterium]|jgi:glycosyltransferase involved in cell wall biosynthesis
MRTCVIIPALNESRKIGELIKQARSFIADIFVIDDGSTDQTARVARENGAQVLRNERNLGKGACLVKGYAYALEKGFDAVISMDGDGQHSPEDLPAFLKAAEGSGNALIIGNRMFDPGKMPFVRILTNRAMSWLLSLVTKQNIPDTQCGFRLVKKALLEKVNLVTSKFEMESEILIKASRRGFKIISVRIKTIYGNQKSQINPFVDTFRFLRFLARELLRRIKRA